MLWIDKHKLSNLKSKFLYYPIAAQDIVEPVQTFREILDEFWFVDTGYFSGDSPAADEVASMKFPGFRYLQTELVGPVHANISDNRDDRPRNLEPGIRKDFYEFQGRTICVNRRRGYGYNGLFGPTTLPIDLKRLGVFFYRGDSYDGGSCQAWMSNRPVLMLTGEPRVSLLSKVIDALPSGGILATDGSNHNPLPWRNVYKGDIEYIPLFEPMTEAKSNKEALDLAKDFSDSHGNRFSCIGCTDRYERKPTLLWQIYKDTG